MKKGRKIGKWVNMKENVGKIWKREKRCGKGRREGWEATAELPPQPNGSHHCPELRNNATMHQEGPKIAKSFSKEGSNNSFKEDPCVFHRRK